MADLLYRTYRFIGQHRWKSLVVISLLLFGLALMSSKVQFDDDITALIPANKEVKRIQKVLKSITFTDKIVVNVQKLDQGSVDDMMRYANALLDSLEKNQGQYIKTVQGKVNSDDLPKTMELIYANLPLFLEDTDYEAITEKFDRDSIAKITESNYHTLISPSGIVAKKNIVKDPLGLTFLALKKLQQLGISEDFKLKNGFLLDERESNILLFITPRFGSNETDKNTAFSDALYALQKELNSAYDSKVRSEYYGAALVAVANAKQIRSDIQFTVSIAMTLLIILLIVFYRKLALPFILFLPTVFGALLSIAFLYLLRDKISIISLGIGSVLLGVTLDYALHILTHIRSGNSIQTLYKEVAPSILMSSLTTASAFLCLLFLESQALQDLGIFAAVSVLGASIFALLFIPQVYRYEVRKSKQKTVLDKIALFDFHRSKWAISILAIVFGISLFTYHKVVFNQDLVKLNFESQVLLDARKRLEKLTDISSKSIYLSTYGAPTDSVLERNDSLYREMKRLEADKKIISFSSIGGLIRSNSSQEAQIKAWKEFWSREKIAEIRNKLIESGTEFGFKPTTFNPFYDLLSADFEPMEIDDFNEIKSFAVDDFIVDDDNGTTITSLVKVDDEHIDALRKQFDDEPNTLLIDRQQVNESFLGNLKNDFNRLIGYSLIVLVLILFLFYRSVSLTLVTGLPIFLTWFLTIGIMGLLHIEFNIFNIIICSFIFGLGVDYSIFVTNGLLTDFRTDENVFSTHKTSIILSVITTLAGVGALIFAKHPVLITISTVSLIGILSAVFVAFAAQPLLFQLFIGSSRKRPIPLRYLIHSTLSFFYFGLGGLMHSAYAMIILKGYPKQNLKPNLGFHTTVSKLMKSVLYTNPFVSKKIKNPQGETFDKPAMLIANHTSFLDILAIGMLNPKIIFLVNDWVYNSPIFGKAAKLAGAYPVSGGIENGEEYLRKKVDQGFSLIAFPEGTRSTSNKIKRFHKGAFYLAERFNLDILPVLIHGNSEVLPKGSFIIRDGSITIEILPRIAADDFRFGQTYTERSKKIGAYFRREFRRLRHAVEDSAYWHSTILENFRYKGDTIYRSVKNDLETNQKFHNYLLSQFGEKEEIAHISNSYGQLDLLLALDSIDRKIRVYLESEKTRKVLKNSFLLRQYSKITVVDSLEETIGPNTDTLLIDYGAIDTKVIENIDLQRINRVMVRIERAIPDIEEIQKFGFTIDEQNDNFIILKKAGED
ncbi:MMPL family transporter [Pareuzebyella sediminis]|uniref:MMPL family transporter n=1 Tax=Pareuzebyella sediminis TaxID=2607998 RepID=UPI0011EE581C|nr:MMPL family transporter [Pareuzebyella sediminis]